MIGEPTMTPDEEAAWEARMRPRAMKATTTGTLSSRVHGAGEVRNPRLTLTEGNLRRFFALVSFDSNNGCWDWVGANSRGYGRFHATRVDGQKKLVLSHRWLYESLVGPIEQGLQLDHLCRRPCCVNPDHLEPVTNRENTLRGVGFAAVNAKKDYCPAGHPYSGANLYTKPNGFRICRTCKRHQRREALTRKKTVPAAPQIYATRTSKPRTHKDGRGGFPVSPSTVIPGSVIPRPSCKHIYVLPTPEPGVAVADGVCRLCGAVKPHRLHLEMDYWEGNAQHPLSLKGSRRR